MRDSTLLILNDKKSTSNMHTYDSLSPAKTLDFETSPNTTVCTQPEFLDLTDGLIKGLSLLSSEEVGKLMHISPKLADLNKDRFQKWRMEHDQQNSKQAILAFKGDVYEGLKAWEFKKIRLYVRTKTFACFPAFMGYSNRSI